MGNTENLQQLIFDGHWGQPNMSLAAGNRELVVQPHWRMVIIQTGIQISVVSQLYGVIAPVEQSTFQHRHHTVAILRYLIEYISILMIHLMFHVEAHGTIRHLQIHIAVRLRFSHVIVNQTGRHALLQHPVVLVTVEHYPRIPVQLGEWPTVHMVIPAVFPHIPHHFPGRVTQRRPVAVSQINPVQHPCGFVYMPHIGHP